MQRDSSRSASHRRPRLMRACATEPSSIITASIANHSPASPSDSSMSGRPNAYRRATDLLNRVAYMSACASSPNATYTSSPRRPTSLRSVPGTSSEAIGVSHGPGSRGAAVAVNTRSSGEDIRSSRRRSSEDVFGSSPASTNTGTSLDDDLHSPSHPYSVNYFSFPSFDTWDPDSQDKEDEDGKMP
ncbi:hypothetical protein CMQ_6162 [Grosmannia clavigera kw1407]|uniref:Uncharacterized protein n=1 Tax=Grosmannia clavigera (strain kw1407 / UAMH 11150) TaxID=655863 RepID=F0XM19_GROCL|nr:uncharacterized protein CMQ_6162 [Grosmannia clavigera kw1407]EFX01220.1 hypothetical protein CMQ_6162 [Grosmannia clavigera kw1407]